MAGQLKLNKLIYDAVIKLCCEQLDSEHSSRLEIDGIICIATEEPDNQIVVKIHEKLRNVSISSTSKNNCPKSSVHNARHDDHFNNHCQTQSSQENGHDPSYALSNGIDGPVSLNANQRELSYGNESAQEISSVLDIPGVKDEGCRIVAENNLHLQNSYGATAFPDTIESESRMRLQSETSMRLQSSSSQFSSGSAIMPSFHSAHAAASAASTSGQGSILGKLLTSSKRNKIRSSVLQSQRGRFTKCIMCSAMFRSHSHLRNHLRSGFCGKQQIQTEASRVMNVFASHHETTENMQMKNSTQNETAISSVSETSIRADGSATSNDMSSEQQSPDYEVVVKPEPPDNGYESNQNMNGQSEMNLEGVDLSQHADSLPNTSPVQHSQSSSVLTFPPLDSTSPNFQVQSSGTVKSTYEVTLQRAASKFSMSSQLFGSALSRKVRASANQHNHNQISQKPNFNERGHFQCSFCAFEVQNWGIFEAHSQREHNRSLCKVCGAAFTFRTNKNRHEKTCAGLVLFTCEICGKNCKRSDALRLHKIKAHPWRFEFTT
ncbi:zinc finger protein 236-like isoform X2 [Argonauta hians]